MKQYLKLLQDIIDFGEYRSKEEERTGTGTKGLFGYQYTCPDVAENFPLLTTKKIHLKSVITELLWKMSGSTNIRPLLLQKNRIWTEWPYNNWIQKNNLEKKYPRYSEEWHEQKEVFSGMIISDPGFAEEWGELGPTYGHHMRNFGGFDPRNEIFVQGFDQLADVINTIKKNPGSRRIIMSLWHSAFTEYTLLPPCPCFYHFAVLGEKLHLQMYQRSCDVFLGVPFNTAQDSLMLMIVAQICGIPAGDFVHTFGDVHIYGNHMEQVKLQLSREPRPLPKMLLDPNAKILEDFSYHDSFQLVGYDPHSAIQAQVAV